MVDDILKIRFVYEQGSADELLADHEQQLREATSFDVSESGKFVKSTSFGSFELVPRNEVEKDYEAPHAPYVEYSQTNADLLHVESDDPRDIEPTEPLEDLAELVVAGYEASVERPLFVFGLSPQQNHSQPTVTEPPATGASLGEDRLEYLSWLQILPPAMVETYGRETLLNTSAWKAEELDNGAILLICSDDTKWWGGESDVADDIGIDSWRDRTES